MNRVRKREQAPRTPNAAAQWPSAWDFAKRLECVRLAGAFHSSRSQCKRKSESWLSVNLRVGQASTLRSTASEDGSCLPRERTRASEMRVQSAASPPGQAG